MAGDCFLVVGSCHLVTIPASANQLSDALMTSPIIGASGNYSGGGSSGGGGAHGDFDFGVDPSADPELAMVSHVHDSIGLCVLFLPKSYSIQDTG